MFIFRSLCPSRVGAAFWKIFHEQTHTLLLSSKADDFSTYFLELSKLFKALFTYLSRSILAFVLAFSPLFLVAHFLYSPAMKIWYAQTPYLEVSPAKNATLTIDGNSKSENIKGRLLYGLPGDNEKIVLKTESWEKNLSDSRMRYGFSDNLFFVTLFRILGFKNISTLGENVGGSNFIVVRPSKRDKNPLWPFLSDIEFLFFVFLITGSLTVFIRKR